MAKAVVVVRWGQETLGRILVELEPRHSFPERVGQAFASVALNEPYVPLHECYITFEGISAPAANDT